MVETRATTDSCIAPVAGVERSSRICGEGRATVYEDGRIIRGEWHLTSDQNFDVMEVLR
jgi:hypothetical protein